MKVSNPSVSWPNHTTLVTGIRPARHSVLFNGVLIRDEQNGTVRIDPRKDKRELVSVPTIYDMLHEQDFVPARSTGHARARVKAWTMTFRIVLKVYRIPLQAFARTGE
jgi:hypothetical protein